jgi:hypothetical protein
MKELSSFWMKQNLVATLKQKYKKDVSGYQYRRGSSSDRIMSGDQVRRILFEGKGVEAADAAGEFSLLHFPSRSMNHREYPFVMLWGVDQPAIE